MSFSFGFNDNDLNSDDENLTGSQNINSSVQDNVLINPLDDEKLLDSSIIQPQEINLVQCIESLRNVRVTFEKFTTPITSTTLYRRELFDIKHQLMLENDDQVANTDQNISNSNNELDILINEDLKKNVYEGGLKSWECSLDLVDTLVSNDKKYTHVIELGCGTALPTEYLFTKYLLSNSNYGLQIILTDYNDSVLRLASLPNLIITWAKLTLNNDQWQQLQRVSDETIPILEDELLLTEQLLNSFYQDMLNRNIDIKLIYGTWSRNFINILYSLIKDIDNINMLSLVLTSETIYQPEMLPVISETLIEIKDKLHNSDIFVAAKDIYFGVGGSILDFEKYLSQKNINFETFKVNAGLKRSIVSIK